VANTHRTRQVGHLGTVLEDLGSHAVGLQLVDPTPGRTGCNTGCILTTICPTGLVSRSLVEIINRTHVGGGRGPHGDPRQPRMRGSPGSEQ
jgi:hypothetical protein